MSCVSASDRQFLPTARALLTVVLLETIWVWFLLSTRNSVLMLKKLTSQSCIMHLYFSKMYSSPHKLHMSFDMCKGPFLKFVTWRCWWCFGDECLCLVDVYHIAVIKT